MANNQRTANSLIFGVPAGTITSRRPHFTWTLAQKALFDAHAIAHPFTIDKFEHIPQLLVELGLDGFQGIRNVQGEFVHDIIMRKVENRILDTRRELGIANALDRPPPPARRQPMLFPPAPVPSTAPAPAPIVPPATPATPAPAVPWNPLIPIDALHRPLLQAFPASSIPPVPLFSPASRVNRLPHPAPQPQNPAYHVNAEETDAHIKQEPDSDDDFYIYKGM
ncbi:hypothetical protein RRF57_013390 [Xylaria bambusicola]|uniref:Uncharacterized protein n=1 Tax=Xylaria bambusicola TaxID=326684 RepID=A0AAN7URP4_9PEZI